MSNIRFVSPPGVSSILLSNGQKLPTLGGLSVDSRFANELEAAGFQAMPDLAAKDLQYPGTLVTDWGASGALSTTGSTGTGFSFSLDTATQLNGKPTVKAVLPSDATAQTFIGIWTPTDPIRLRDVQSIQVPIMFTSHNGSNIDWSSVRVWIQTSDAKSVRLSLQGLTTGYRAGIFQTVSFSRASASASTQDPMSSLDTTGVTITSIRLVVSTTGNAAAFPIWLGEIRADVRRTPGRVCIVMDGEYSSQYSLIYPMMQQLGLAGSLAITNFDIGLNGRMTASQIGEMYDAGWECIHHTYDSTKANGYVNSTDWPTAASIAGDVRSSWAYFKARGWVRGIGYGVWAYAYAFVTAQTQVRQNLVRAGLLAGGILAARKSVSWNGENGNVLVPMTRMPIDPLVIHGGIQVSNSDTAATLKAVIDAAESRGELAIITLHRAVDDSTTPGSLEIKIGELTAAMTYLASRVIAGGLVVEPFGQTCSRVFPDRLAS